jgi:SH3 domain-containing protein
MNETNLSGRNPLISSSLIPQGGELQSAKQGPDGGLGLVVRPAPGDTGAEPVTLNTETQAGPLLVTVTQATLGDEANQLVLSASDRNLAPSDGVSYAAASVRVVNGGTTSIVVDHDDFGFTTSAGRLRRSIGIVPPEPPLSARLNPGDQAEGWVAGIVESGDPNTVLAFSSRDLGGNWADRYFALVDGATLDNVAEPAAAVNEEGKDPAAPAGVGQAVITEDWSVAIAEVVAQDAVVALYPDSDYRTTALASAAPEVVENWIGLRVEIQHNGTGGAPRHFPVTAFGLAYADGSEVPDVRILSAPLPDLGGQYFPGARATGWVTIEIPALYDGSLVRFQPFRTDTDVRYLTWADGSAPAASTADEPTPEADDAVYEAGTNVVVIESDVNMRDAPSTSGEIVETLARDTALVVTGGPEEADGYSWYQVEDPETGLEGFVASNFLRPAE